MTARRAPPKPPHAWILECQSPAEPAWHPCEGEKAWSWRKPPVPKDLAEANPDYRFRVSRYIRAPQAKGRGRKG